MHSQDSKVVPQVSARHAQGPHRAQHEHPARGEQRDREQLDLCVPEESRRGLLGECIGVEVIPDQSEGED